MVRSLSSRGVTEDVGNVPIFTYHSIDDSGSVVSISPAVFREHMKYLYDLGYSAVSLREVLSSLVAGSHLPAKTVVLSFDDGFRNFYTNAFPVLHELGFTATVFLVTDFCGRHNDWGGNPPELPRSELLSWDQIRELDSQGIEFGSHTKTHPDLTSIDIKAAELEMVSSKADIEDVLGRPTQTFAYPFGRNNAAIKLIAAANYEASCSVTLGKVAANYDLSSLKRIDAYYLRSRRVLQMLPSSKFDKYMSIRQALRTVKSYVT